MGISSLYIYMYYTNEYMHVQRRMNTYIYIYICTYVYINTYMYNYACGVYVSLYAHLQMDVHIGQQTSRHLHLMKAYTLNSTDSKHLKPEP